METCCPATCSTCPDACVVVKLVSAVNSQCDVNTTRSNYVPTAITSLTSLREVEIRDCTLGGTIPTLNVSSLNLYNSAVSGTLSKDQFAANLEVLELGWSRVSGTIPLANAPQALSSFAIARTPISGLLPVLFSANLKYVELHAATEMSGTLPSCLFANINGSDQVRHLN